VRTLEFSVALTGSYWVEPRRGRRTVAA